MIKMPHPKYVIELGAYVITGGLCVDSPGSRTSVILHIIGELIISKYRNLINFAVSIVWYLTIDLLYKPLKHFRMTIVMIAIARSAMKILNKYSAYI